MRAVFDLDDTISIHKNRDYPNATPIIPVIEKIRKMKADGWEIIIYSARGQVSCKGNIDLIEERNRPVVEKWLQEHAVPFDGLIFGKPIADLYVDDKGMGLQEFIDSPFEYLNGGGSGGNVYRFGNIVKKSFNSPFDTEQYKRWEEDKQGCCLSPKVHSYLYDSVYMDYIEGERLSECATKREIEQLIEITERFRSRKTSDKFSIAPQIEILMKNESEDEEMNRIIRVCKTVIEKQEMEIAKNQSFSHGDMILSNAIKAEDGIYLIDSRYIKDSSSYLFDLAKLRMSLSGYEYLFKISAEDKRHLRQDFDGYLKDRGILSLVVALNLMYVCRLYRYKASKDRSIVKKMAKEILHEHEELFGKKW